MIELELLKISYRYINSILPVRISNLFDIGNHNYLTRNRNYLRAPHHTIEQFNKSYLGKAPHLWLHLSESLKERSTLKAFIKAFTEHKIKSY